MKTNTSYFIYDERYYTNPDSATVYEVCDTLKEARESGPDYGGFVIVKVAGESVGRRGTFKVLSCEIVN